MADLVLNPKAPGETVRYTIDWSEIDPDTIDSFTLTRTAGTITISGDSDNDETNVYALISGGTDGETATFTCTIVTSLGQTRIKSVTLGIDAGADVASPVSTITKGTIVNRALGKLGIANYVFDLEAEEIASGLRELDSLAANWQAKLSQLPYTQPATYGTSSPSDVAGVDEADVDAFVHNLAEIIAGDYGKTPAPGVLKRSAETRSDLFIKYQIRREYQYPSRVPRGAGNDRYGARFFNGG